MKEKLKKLTDLGVSVTTIANGIGVSRGAVNNWLSGARNISEENEMKLWKWLDRFKAEIAEV